MLDEKVFKYGNVIFNVPETSKIQDFKFYEFLECLKSQFNDIVLNNWDTFTTEESDLTDKAKSFSKDQKLQFADSYFTLHFVVNEYLDTLHLQLFLETNYSIYTYEEDDLINSFSLQVAKNLYIAILVFFQKNNYIKVLELISSKTDYNLETMLENKPNQYNYLSVNNTDDVIIITLQIAG